VVRTFDRGWWVSAGVAYVWGGESKLNGVGNDDDHSDLLAGASIGFPINASQSFRLTYFRYESLVETGSDTHNVMAGWSIRF
jgi:hypothetical protein